MYSTAIQKNTVPSYLGDKGMSLEYCSTHLRILLFVNFSGTLYGNHYSNHRNNHLGS